MTGSGSTLNSKERPDPQFIGDKVRRVIVIRRNLNGELAARGERIGPSAQDADVVGHPLQTCVREHEVDVARRCPATDVAEFEPKQVTRMRFGVAQHRRRRIDSERDGCTKPNGGSRRQLTGTAAEIDHTGDRSSDEIDKVPEGLGPLGRKPAVLLGVPVGRLLLWP